MKFSIFVGPGVRKRYLYFGKDANIILNTKEKKGKLSEMLPGGGVHAVSAFWFISTFKVHNLQFAETAHCKTKFT